MTRREFGGVLHQDDPFTRRNECEQGTEHGGLPTAGSTGDDERRPTLDQVCEYRRSIVVDRSGSTEVSIDIPSRRGMRKETHVPSVEMGGITQCKRAPSGKRAST